MILTAHRVMSLLAIPGLTIPQEGWRPDSFKAQASKLARTLHRASMITRRLVGNRIQRTVSVHIQDFAEAVADHARAGKSFSYETKAEIGMNVGALWDDALRNALRDSKGALAKRLLPEIQSAIGQGYSRTSMLLSTTEPGDAAAQLKLAKALAAEAEEMNATNDAEVRRFISLGQEKGMSREEIADELEIAMAKRARVRSGVAGRTITTQAWHGGSIEAMKTSNVSEVSVIGCMSREEDLWDKPYYQAYLFSSDGREPESTCNIQDVPIEYADELVWHPNHTGTVVPSAFNE